VDSFGIVLLEDWYGVAITKVNGSMAVMIGEFVTEVDFEELDVPLYLQPANHTPPDVPPT
jgi:hypothetical protein